MASGNVNMDTLMEELTFADFWKFFTLILMPIILLWSKRLHEDISELSKKIDKVESMVENVKVQTAERYASTDELNRLENRIMLLLTRIDDKIDRLMQGQ